MNQNNYNLTNRELDVLKYIILEYSSKQIADRLFLSFETIRSYRKNIIAKLDVKSTAGIVRVALENDLVDLDDYYREGHYQLHLLPTGS